jgi:hypothetical protein
MVEMTLPIGFKGAYIYVMLGGAISLIIVGGLIYKDVNNTGAHLIDIGKWLIGISLVLYIARWVYYESKAR